MAFFEQIGKHLTDAGQNVAQQTKNLAETTQLNNTISEKEKKISELYISLGKSYYDRHKNDTSATDQKMIEQINTLYSEILECKNKIKKIKGITKCIKCGADIPVNVAFCSNCGTKIILEETPEPKDKDERICNVCGTKISKDNLFCTHCGTKIDNSQE